MFISFNSLPNQPPQFASQPPQFAAQPPQFAALTPPNPSPAPPDLLDQIFDKPVAPTPGGVVAAAGGPSTVQVISELFCRLFGASDSSGTLGEISRIL